MSDVLQEAQPGITRARLWAEMLTLFVGVPLTMAFLLPPDQMWPVLAGATLAGIVILWRTPGFRARSLLTGGVVPDWPFFIAFTLVSSALSVGLILALYPTYFLALPWLMPNLWILIVILYPIVSVIPQELVYRGLFFERYGVLMPDARVAIVVNAVLFSLAHLFFWNWIALGLTFAGGLVFAWARVRRRSFPFAWALHSVGGIIVFTTGLGRFFYHGAIPP